MKMQKILLIDDDAEILESLSTWLSGKEFDVVTAYDGMAGLKLFLREKPDLVLVDLSMPGMNGYQVIKYMAKEFPETPVVVVSGVNSLDEAMEAIRLGAWDYIQKPILRMVSLEYVLSRAFEKARLLEESREYRKCLELRVKEEVEKQINQEALLMHKSRLAASGEMIGAIAHQWRQPLNAISMLAGGMKLACDKGTIEKDNIHETAEAIFEQVDFMSNTINAFRNFLNPEKTSSAFDVRVTVKDVIALTYGTLKNNRVAVNFTCNCSSVSVAECNYKKRYDNLLAVNLKEIYGCRQGLMTTLGYVNEFKQALVNILHNSVDAINMARQREQIQGEGKIDIGISRNNGLVVVKVGDNGGGIPAENIGNIFESYYTTKGDGTGVGLYITKKIIEENMGGRIYASNTDNGAVFTLELKASTT